MTLTPTPTMTLTPTPTPTITPTVIALPILSYDIDTTYTTGNKYLELDFDNSAYSESEIGVITIDNGDNTSITSVYNDGYLSSQHDYLTSGVYNININTTGTKGYEPINLFMCYDWQNINSFDMSVLTNLYYVEVGQNKLSSIQLPNDHHKTWGFEFRFWDSIITNFSWPSFNYSGMIASDQLILSDLPNLSILDIPDSSKMATISLTNLPSISTINHSNVLIVDEYSPTSKCYYQLVNLPNLISLSLPEFNVNMASIRLNGISISGSLDLGITSSICNDLSISGVTNLTSLTFGNATDITTQWLNVIGTNVTTLDLSKFHINYSPTFYSQSQLGINNNPNLTTLTNIGASTGNLIAINISNNPNLGYVDFSNIGGISTSTITRVVLENNNWSAAIINQVLVVLDSKTTSSSYGRIFSIGGNSAPDSTSGGYDGLAAKSSLQSKNITFA